MQFYFILIFSFFVNASTFKINHRYTVVSKISPQELRFITKQPIAYSKIRPLTASSFPNDGDDYDVTLGKGSYIKIIKVMDLNLFSLWALTFGILAILQLLGTIVVPAFEGREISVITLSVVILGLHSISRSVDIALHEMEMTNSEKFEKLENLIMDKCNK